MRYSVLMSVYVKENPKFLEESIKSILGQTIKPSEIVIVKDGILTNELNSVIERFVQAHPNLFTIIEFRENKGLGESLQYGVKACKYDIIGRMDTDDISLPNRFEKQMKVMEENEEIDIVGSYITEFEGDINNVLSIRKVPVIDEQIKKYARKRNPFNHMTVIYRKKAVLEAGNYQSSLWNEDYHLWVRMILKGYKMYNIDESLVYVRSGISMFERRGGVKYAISDIRLQFEFYNMGFINIFQLITNLIIRVSIRLIPNRLRRLIYIKFLRK